MSRNQQRQDLALIRLRSPEETADSLTSACRSRRAAIEFLRHVLAILEARQ